MQHVQTFHFSFSVFLLYYLNVTQYVNSCISRIFASLCGMCCHRKEETQLSMKMESTYANTTDLIHPMHILTPIVFKIFLPSTPHTTSSSILLNQRVHLDNLQKALLLFEDQLFQTALRPCFSKSRKVPVSDGYEWLTALLLLLLKYDEAVYYSGNV